MARIAKPKLRSGLEKKISKFLKDKKVKFSYETERIPYTIPESQHFYIPDFILENGVYIEAKGILDRDTRKKMKLVIEQNPKLDLRILIMRNNKIAKNSKTKYSDWLAKNGFTFAISSEGHIPEEWLEPKDNKDKEEKNAKD